MELFQKGPGNGLAGVIRGPPNLRSGGLEFLRRHRPAPRGKLGPTGDLIMTLLLYPRLLRVSLPAFFLRNLL